MRIRSKYILRLALLLLFAGVFHLSHATIYAAPGDVIISYVNQARINAGIHTLTANGQLQNAAQSHSNWMASVDILSHTGAGNSSPGDRITAAGYSWQAYGENILYRFDTNEDGAFNQWWNSPPHQANMMSSSFCEIGIGVAQSSNTGRYYYTMVLAKTFGQDCTSNSGGGSGALPAPSAPDPSAGVLAPASAGGEGFGDSRINIIDAIPPAAVYCGSTGIDIWIINHSASTGSPLYVVTLAEASQAMSRAVALGSHQLIREQSNISLYALTSRELQLVGYEPNGKRYDFIFDGDLCGTLTITGVTVITDETIAVVSAPTPATTATSTPSTTTASLPASCTHTIQSGENLFRISLRYGLTTSQMASANNISNPALIFAGDTLNIPGCGLT